MSCNIKQNNLSADQGDYQKTPFLKKGLENENYLIYFRLIKNLSEIGSHDMGPPADDGYQRSLSYDN